jgi:hypothetical protein
MKVDIFGTDKPSANTSNGLYCLGCIGAAIYFISKATSFWTGVLGLLKAMVWPALIAYHALKALGVN